MDLFMLNSLEKAVPDRALNYPNAISFLRSHDRPLVSAGTAIKLADAEGRSCIYVPIRENDEIVDSKGYELIPDDATDD